MKLIIWNVVNTLNPKTHFLCFSFYLFLKFYIFIRLYIFIVKIRFTVIFIELIILTFGMWVVKIWINLAAPNKKYWQFFLKNTKNGGVRWDIPGYPKWGLGYPGISQKLKFFWKFFSEKFFYCIFGFPILFAVKKRYLSPFNSYKNPVKNEVKVESKFLRGKFLKKFSRDQKIFFRKSRFWPGFRRSWKDLSTSFSRQTRWEIQKCNKKIF